MKNITKHYINRHIIRRNYNVKNVKNSIINNLYNVLSNIVKNVIVNENNNQVFY